MSDVKQKTAALELKGRKYELVLTLNLIDVLQERYGDMSAVFEKSKEIKELRWILWAFLAEATEIHNDDHPEDIWPELTEKQAGRMITADNMPQVNAALLSAFSLSVPQREEAEEDEEETEKN